MLAIITTALNLLLCNFCTTITTTTVFWHYTEQPALAGIPLKNWTILLQQSFTAQMPLLTAASALTLGRF